MHDLETRLRAWRRETATLLGNRREVLDELESHLREELEVELAPAVAQAWDRALAKLGDPRALAAEFAKATPPARWLPARLAWFAWAGLVLAIVVGAAPPIFARGDTLLAVHVLCVLTGYLGTLLVGALGVCFAAGRLFADWDAGRSRALRRVALPLVLFAGAFTLVGVGLGMQWAQRSWNVAWSWDSKEVGGLTVILANLILAVLLLWRRVPDRLLMGLALLNNILVGLAWFHPLLGIGWNGSLAAYGWSAFAPLLIAFLAVQAALAVLTALPATWLHVRRAS